MTILSVNPTISATEKRDHVVLFPFLAKGHTIPLLHLAAALLSRNILVTVVTTPANAPFVRHHLSSSASTASNLRLILLPFPSHPGLPAGVETTDALPSFSLFQAFLAATTALHDPFLLLLRRLVRSGTPPLCLVSDFFFGWTLPICRNLGLPRLIFHGMSIFSMSLTKSLWNNAEAFSASEPFQVRGAPPALRLNLADIPEFVRNSVDPLDPATQFLNIIGETDIGSWGVIINSFAELEPPAYLDLLESFYRPVAGAQMWLVGPLNLLAGHEPKNSSEACVRWLDLQPDRSVVYVSFGTQASVSDEQLDEVAHGLAQAGFRFLFAARSGTWTAPDAAYSGRIERGWVPQNEVLGHVAVGGFMSHCGWNSVMEAVAAGVPILAWPMIAEQSLNAKLVAEVIGVGLRLALGSASGVVGRKEVEEGVRELMGGEKGRQARERAGEMAKKARDAVAEGGSSCRMLEKLLDELRNFPSATIGEEGTVVDDELNVEWSFEEISCSLEEGQKLEEDAEGVAF